MKNPVTGALAALALAAAFLAPSLIAPASALAADLKVGVVDLQKALNGTKEGEAVKEQLKSRFQPKVDLLNAKRKELADMQDKLKSPVLAKEAKAALQKDFEKKASEYQELGARTQLEQERENKAASGKIIEGLLAICQKLAKDEGYNLLFERSESGLVYFQDAFDLTERVVKTYNEKAAAGGEKKP